MNVTELYLFYYPPTHLRLTIPNEKSYITVKPTWSAPLSQPGRYLALLDGNGEEIVLLTDPKVLSPASLKAVQAELRRNYLTAIILRINNVREEFGVTYWDVETDRGQRQFITQNLQENAQRLNDDHLLLLDVDNCRFEIPSIAALDDYSQKIVLRLV